MPREVLHGVRGGVERVHFWGFDLESRLHPFPKLPLPDLPLAHFPLSQLPLPHGRVGVVEAGDVIGQQRVGGVQGHEEGVVSIGGGHDMGSGILAEGAQGRGVRTDVWRHGCDRCGWAIEGWAHVSWPGHLRFRHSAFMRGTGGFL